MKRKPKDKSKPTTASDAALHPVRGRSRWRGTLVLLMALFVAAIAAGMWFSHGIAIPRPQLKDADPRFISALNEADAQIRRSPRDPDLWARLGALLLAHAFPHEAQQCFQRASELDRTNWYWPYCQAIAQEYESPELAIVSLQTALDRDPQADDARLHLAEQLLSLGRLPEAESQFRLVLKRTASHARARLGLARVLYARNQLDPALEVLGPALTHPCTRQATLRLQAQVLQRQGRAEEAAKSLASAENYPADNPWPGDPLQQFELLRTDRLGYAANALSLQKAGAVQQAHEVARQAESRYPELYFLVEGNMRLEKGDYPGAEAALRQSLLHKPDWVEALLSLGRALAMQSKDDEAISAFQQILALEPSYGPAYLELGRCLKRTDPDRAHAALQSAVQYMPLSASAHEELANLLESEGQTVEARRHAQAADRLKSQ